VGVSGVSLISASLDLRLVRMLRAAMTPVNIGQSLPPAPTGDVRGSRLVAEPTPRFEPRKTVDPTPRIAPRPVYHPRPVNVQRPLIPIPAVVEPEQSRITKSPIEPPWKTLPWQQPPSPQPPLKIVLKQPDVVTRGTVFDAFV